MTLPAFVSIREPESGDVYVAHVRNGVLVGIKNPGARQEEIHDWQSVPRSLVPVFMRKVRTLFPPDMPPLPPVKQGWREVNLDSCVYCADLA